MAQLIDHEGEACVLGDWQADWERPVRRAMIWPTGVKVREMYDRTMIGEELRPERTASGGSYEFVNRCGRVTLKEGGKTISIAKREEPLKPPRGGPWRYHYGEWVNVRTARRVRVG